MKTRNIFLLVLIAVAFAWLLTDLLSSASRYSDFESARGQQAEVHVIGTWVRRTEKDFRPEDNYYSFYMQDTLGQQAQVVYRKGTLGDMSQAERMDVVGKWEGNAFVASKIHLKCPSKYNNAGPVTTVQGPNPSRTE